MPLVNEDFLLRAFQCKGTAKQRPWMAGFASATTLVTSLIVTVPTFTAPTAAQQVVQTDNSELITDLLDEELSVRDEALAKLQASGQSVQILEKALQSTDWQVRVIAAYHLGQIRADATSAVLTLASRLSDQHPDVRFSAAQALGKIGSGAANDKLLAAIEDSDDAVRIAATDALLTLIDTIETREQLSVLKTALVRDTNTPHNYSLNLHFQFLGKDPLAAPEIAVARQEQVTDNLVQALGHRNWFIRQTAARKLAEFMAADERVIRQLLPSVRQIHNGYARKVVAELLANLDRDRLIALARTKNEDLALIFLLGVSVSNEAIPELLQHIRSSDFEYAAEAASALGQIGTPEAISVLVRETGIDIPYAFAGRHSEVLTQEFYRRLTSQDRATRQSVLNLTAYGLDSFPNVVDAIEQMPSEKALEILLPELKFSDPMDSLDDPRIRSGAASLLELLPQSIVVDNVRNQLSPIELFAVLYETKFGSGEFDQELVSHQDLVTTAIEFAQAQLVRVERQSQLREKFTWSRQVGDLRLLVRLLEYFAEAGSAEARAGLLELMDQDEILTEALDLEQILSLANGGYPPEIETYLANQFWGKWDNANGNLSPKDIALQLKILDVLDDYSLKKILIPTLREHRLKALNDTELEKFRRAVLEQIHRAAIGAFVDLGPGPYRQSIDIWQMQQLSIDLERYAPLILESLERQDETFFEWYGLSHARAIELLVLDEGYSDQAIDAALNLLSRSTWKSYEDGIDILYAIDILIETLEKTSEHSATPKPVLIRALESPYTSTPALQIALRNKQADYRRTIALAIGQQQTVSEAHTKALKNTVDNFNENLEVRWMAAAVLHNLGHNTDGFFLAHQLPHPRMLSSTFCSHDSISIGLEYSVDEIPTNEELLYFGRCAYGDTEEGGGPWEGIYNTIKELLERAQERDSD